jgi:hypothetical protein
VLGHGTPIDSRDLGQPAPFILEAGISSTRRIAEFWGLLAAARPAVAEPQALPKIEAALLHRSAPSRQDTENVIMRALRAAGLLKR